MKRIVYVVIGVIIIFTAFFAEDSSQKIELEGKVTMTFMALIFLYLGIIKPIRLKIRQRNYARMQAQQIQLEYERLQFEKKKQEELSGLLSALEKKKQKTPYSILRITEDAPREVVEAAYRALSKKYHPDVNLDQAAESIYKRIQDAHDKIIEQT